MRLDVLQVELHDDIFQFEIVKKIMKFNNTIQGGPKNQTVLGTTKVR